MRCLVALLFATALPAQTVRRVVITSPAAFAGDSTDHRDLRVGQTVKLTATATDARGQVIRGQVVRWSSSTPATASVGRTGSLTGNALGVATIAARVGTVTGTLLACVAPDSVTWLDVVVTHAGNRTVQLDAQYQGVRLSAVGAGRCVHYRLERGPATPGGPTATQVRVGHDGLVTLGSVSNFYPSAWVGAVPPKVQAYVVNRPQFTVAAGFKQP